MLLAQACAFNGTPISTAYDSLGPDGLAHALNEGEVRAMFTGGDLLGTLAQVISKCETVKLIVYDGKPDEGVREKLLAVREGLHVVSLDEVRRVGREKPVEAAKVGREDVYCCMYTSGSSKWSFLPRLQKLNRRSGNTERCASHSRERRCRQ